MAFDDRYNDHGLLLGWLAVSIGIGWPLSTDLGWPSAENLWQHESVVESVMRRCEAVLPVRFGMTFGDEVALEDTIARHGAVLATGLERVRGCVEMGVRVVSRLGRSNVSADG